MIPSIYTDSEILFFLSRFGRFAFGPMTRLWEDRWEGFFKNKDYLPVAAFQAYSLRALGASRLEEKTFHSTRLY